MSNFNPAAIDWEKFNIFKAEILSLRRGGSATQPKPHKIVMLLAVIELVETGSLVENKIYFDQNLIDTFKTIFERVQLPKDWNQPAPPFFHLRSSNFWKHKVWAGREQQYALLQSSGGGSYRILKNIEFAYLSNDAFEVIMTSHTRAELGIFLEELLRDYLFYTNLN